MKFQNLSVKRLFGRVAMELVLSMSGIDVYKRQLVSTADSLSYIVAKGRKVTAARINRGEQPSPLTAAPLLWYN